MKSKAAMVLAMAAALAGVGPAGSRNAAMAPRALSMEELFSGAVAGRQATVEGIVQRATRRTDGQMVLRMRTRIAGRAFRDWHLHLAD